MDLNCLQNCIYLILDQILSPHKSMMQYVTCSFIGSFFLSGLIQSVLSVYLICGVCLAPK